MLDLEWDELEAWQQRVVKEFAELQKRRQALDVFTTVHTGKEAFKKLSIHDQELMLSQLYHMREYENILARRIMGFKKNG